MGAFFRGEHLDFWYAYRPPADCPKPRSAGWKRSELSVNVSMTANVVILIGGSINDSDLTIGIMYTNLVSRLTCERLD
jgi:hypothetical protein